jgi:acetyl esterase/lipase
MPLHPIAQAIVNQLQTQPPLHTLSVAEARASMREFARAGGPGEPVAGVSDLVIPGAVTGIPVRLYTPAGHGPFPVLVHFHMGGWTVGDLDTDDATCRVICNAAGCIVASVNYRHAPEHKFPAAVDDAYDATCWLAAHAGDFNGDASRLAVGGASSGANLAAVVARRARDRAQPRIVYQVLTVPVTNFAFDTPSYMECGRGYGLEDATGEWFWNNYLATPGDGEHPDASPIRAKDLRGLPPALVMTAQYDPLRDEGAAYAQRLANAGVPVTYRCYAGMIHFFLGPESIADIGRQLGAAFAPRSGRGP